VRRYDLALIGGALLAMKEELHLSGASHTPYATFLSTALKLPAKLSLSRGCCAEWEQEAIVGFAKLGAVLGTFVGGAIMSSHG
jgi:hypothetical protein